MEFLSLKAFGAIYLAIIFIFLIIFFGIINSQFKTIKEKFRKNHTIWLNQPMRQNQQVKTVYDINIFYERTCVWTAILSGIIWPIGAPWMLLYILKPTLEAPLTPAIIKTKSNGEPPQKMQNQVIKPQKKENKSPIKPPAKKK